MSAPLQRPDATTPKVHTLSNGVRVVCDPIPGLQTVALSVVAGRGARPPCNASKKESPGWIEPRSTVVSVKADL